MNPEIYPPDLLNRTTDKPLSKSRFRPKSKNGGKDQVIINPPDKVQESAEKTAVLAFGRMNPPTVGHEKLIKKVHEEAKKRKASAHVFVSHTQDKKKNPLSQEDKIGYVKKIAPEGVHVRGSSKEKPTPLHAAKQLHDEGHKHLVIVAGEDRAKEMHERISKYNGHPGHYNFKSISVVSSGHRDPDADGVEGMSGTKMREHAQANNHEKFKSGLPKALHPHAKEIMSKVRKGMSINEARFVLNNIQSLNALQKKADQSNMPYEILHEVFMRGYRNWNETNNKTCEQAGFERVNSFINKGKTFFEADRDLAESALSYPEQSKVLQLVKAGLVDDSSKRQFVNIINKLRNLEDISKLQLQDQKFLVKMYDELMDHIISDNQLFNRMLYILRRK